MMLKKIWKIRRGPKLEGYAFANFGYSSETEGELRQKMGNSFWDSLKIRQKIKKLKIAVARNRTRDLAIRVGFSRRQIRLF